MATIKVSFKVNGTEFNKVFIYEDSFISFVNTVLMVNDPTADILNKFEDCKRYIRSCPNYSYEMVNNEEFLFHTVSDALNRGIDLKEVIRLHSFDHRTLQQKFTSYCLSWIEKVGSSDYGFDGRNEYSHKQCEKIKMFMEENGISSGMPLI